MIDLHAHTDRSDGSTDAADLVRLAIREGIEALGISDHDTLAGYDAALPAATASGLELVCAVELSTRPSEPKPTGKRQPSVHLLSYWLLAPPSTEIRCWQESQQESVVGGTSNWLPDASNGAYQFPFVKLKFMAGTRWADRILQGYFATKAMFPACRKPLTSISPMKPRPALNAKNQLWKKAFNE